MYRGRRVKAKLVYDKGGASITATSGNRLATLSIDGQYTVSISQHRFGKYKYSVNGSSKTKKEVEAVIQDLLRVHRPSFTISGNNSIQSLEPALDLYRGLELFQNYYLSKM